MAVLDVFESKAYTFGVEGELVNFEGSHNKKWQRIALDFGIVANAIDFQNLWQTELAGIGDIPIYKNLAAKYKTKTGKDFIPWLECCEKIKQYLIEDKDSWSMVDGAKEFVEKARADGKSMVIATHGEADLVAIQFDFMRSNGLDPTGISVVSGDADPSYRKDKDGYLRAFEIHKQNLHKDGVPDITLADVTVFDDSPKYVLRAQELGMKASHISKELAAHLRQHTINTPVSWKDALRKLAAVVPVFLVKSAALFQHLRC